MPETVLHAEIGRVTGSRESRRLRREGKIPGVVYGHGTDPVPVAVVGRELRVALSGDSGVNTLLSLQAGDTSWLTLAREMQRHPVRGTVTHVDFLIVRRDEVIAADVPLTLVGDAIEVSHGDGHVDQQLFSLPVKAKPADIPASVELDVSGLTIGAALRVADIALPAGVTADLEGEVVVVVGQPPRVVSLEGEAAAEGEAAGAPGEEGGAGEAPAASASSDDGGEG